MLGKRTISRKRIISREEELRKGKLKKAAFMKKITDNAITIFQEYLEKIGNDALSDYQ